MSINIGSQAVKAFYFGQKKLSRLILNAKTVWIGVSKLQYTTKLWVGSVDTGAWFKTDQVNNNLYSVFELTDTYGNRSYYGNYHQAIVSNKSTNLNLLPKYCDSASSLASITVNYTIATNTFEIASLTGYKVTGVYGLSSEQYISGGGRTPSYQRFWALFRKNMLPSREAIV